MVRRYRFVLLSLISCMFLLFIWDSGQNRTTSYREYITELNELNNLFWRNVWHKPEMETDEFTYDSGEHENKTVVLMWTKYYHLTNESLMELILSGQKWDPGCCFGTDLIVTLDRRYLARATVIVFFNYAGNLNRKDLPPTRTSDQIWVVFSKESPTLSLGLQQFPNMFNWTMSYRRDSDIYSPYGFTMPLENPIPPEEPILMPGDIPLSDWIASKTDVLAGVISHCPTNSQRERLVRALQNACLPVDIYGACGKHQICPRTRKSCDHDKFWNDLGAKYKFYYAAENSMCVDYITEKFWRTLERGMVPLAYGGANYTAVAPPNSFIDVRDFQSPEEIANHLRNLAKDPEEYSKYFEWRRKYNVRLTDAWHGWCKLCKLARQYHRDRENMDVSPNKSYQDLSNWWRKEAIGSNQSACTGPYFSLPK